MSVVRPQIRFTYEDYRSLPESMDKRYELLDGDLVMVPAPTTRHQPLSRNLGFILHAHVRSYGLGVVLHAPVDVVLGEGRDREVVQPDIFYIGQGRDGILLEQEVRGAPDLVVEILSPGTEERDRGYKKALYGRYGVRECWIVDPEAETVEVYVYAGNEAKLRETHGADDRMEPVLFPGLVIDLDEVFHTR